MIIVLTAIFLFGFITVAFVGLREAKLGVDSLQAQPDYQAEAAPVQPAEQVHPARWHSTVCSVDGLEASRFTSSLLALSKAQTQWTRNSPAHVRAESSSLALIRQPESRSLVQEPYSA